MRRRRAPARTVSERLTRASRDRLGGLSCCAPAAMNNSAGLQAVLGNVQAVRTLGLCLTTTSLKVKEVVVELLAALWCV